MTRTDNNNGIHSLVSKQNKEINKGNCLTIGLDTQTCFYQEEDFYTGQNIHIFRVKKDLSPSIYCFLSVLIKKQMKLLFRWGDNGATLGRLQKQSIKLPVKQDGSPDWDYIENYIKDKKSELLSAFEIAL
ncbi:restriction endonuclease subunit S [Mycoplasmopsis cynos]|uniref:restriction endonuclease subunit S n=1 Tax=Mycoplasmopsis cynos TaxID=171284 RepID=UPI00396A3239